MARFCFFGLPAEAREVKQCLANQATLLLLETPDHSHLINPTGKLDKASPVDHRGLKNGPRRSFLILEDSIAMGSKKAASPEAHGFDISCPWSLSRKRRQPWPEHGSQRRSICVWSAVPPYVLHIRV